MQGEWCSHSMVDGLVSNRMDGVPGSRVDGVASSRVDNVGGTRVDNVVGTRMDVDTNASSCIATYSLLVDNLDTNVNS